MLHVYHGEEKEKYRSIFDQMTCLRADQFSTRRGWQVTVNDGKEVDRFDQMNPLYVCLLSQEQRLLASLRLLPTMGPHMLCDVFPEVMGDTGIVRNPLVWESSRFCVDTKAIRDFGDDGINIVTRAILAGLFSTASSAGLEYIISVYDIFVERILRRSGCKFERLGPIVRYDDLKTVAGLFAVDENLKANITMDRESITDLLAA